MDGVDVGDSHVAFEGESIEQVARAAPLQRDPRSFAGQGTDQDAAIAAVIERCGRLDVAISNAGVVRSAPFLDITPEQWAFHLDSNLTGCFHVGQAAARQMVAQGRGGLILFTGSWVPASVIVWQHP